MTKLARTTAILLTLAATFGAPGIANATYFVRPVLQYDGEFVDGYQPNGPTTGSQTFSNGSTTLQSFVNLTDGTIKTFVEANGPTNTFTIATGVMGDQIRYTGSSEQSVSFRFDFDSLISANQQFTGTPGELESRYIGIQAFFAIYEAGTGANYNNWTVFGSAADQALYNDYADITFNDEMESFDTFYSGSLGTDLFLTSGKSYDVFAAFNLLINPGSLVGPVTMNSLNTSRIGIDAPAGGFTSESGVFLGFDPTPTGAVPEPATWAMMIGGIGAAGGGLRRRRASVSVRYA